MFRCLAGTSAMSRPPIRSVPLNRVSSPAISRSRVVFPAPDGPTTARNSPGRTSRLTSCSEGRVAIALGHANERNGHAPAPSPVAEPPLHQRLRHQSHERKHAQARRHRKGRSRLVVVVERFDMQRHRLGDTRDVPRHHTDTAPELAERACRAQQHASQHRPR